MGPETHSPSAAPVTAASRCPHCSGAVRADAPWCTQCWADLRPAPAPVPEPLPVPVARPAGCVAAATSTAIHAAAATDVPPPVGHGLRGWPCSGCGAVNAVELDACTACGTGFLAGLRREEPPLLVLPGVGDVTRLSRPQRLGLAGAVVLVVALLVLVLGLLTG